VTERVAGDGGEGREWAGRIRRREKMKVKEREQIGIVFAFGKSTEPVGVWS